MLNGLSCVHLELTSRCNKECWMCGRRKVDKDYPDLKLNYGDMDLDLVYKILGQLPSGIVVQFHNNGEPLLYPRLKEALSFRSDLIRCLNTNGKLLYRSEIREALKKYLDVLTISVIENDPEGDEQLSTVFEFFMNKYFENPPFVVFRLLGNVKNREKWEILAKVHNCLITTRILHNPMGSFDYTHETTKPEFGICLDLLTHMAINKDGKVSICVRFDPNGYGIIGDATKESLEDIWNGKKRKEIIELHKNFKRKDVKLCSKCDFWGIPRGI